LGQGAELQSQRAQVALTVCADAERRAPALKLTHSFLARKEREYDQLHAQIAALRAELAARTTLKSEAGS
jgi:hypothetical protein